MNILIKLIPAALFALLLVGCGETGTRPDGGAPVSGSGGAETSAANLQGGRDSSQFPTGDPNNPLGWKLIYFEYDRSEILPEYRNILLAHAKHLSSNPHISVTLEGHGDERGSREYNIALGERRANTVKRFLTAAGVPASQMMTISYGEERPNVLGTGEAAWSKNRRVELIY